MLAPKHSMGKGSTTRLDSFCTAVFTFIAYHLYTAEKRLSIFFRHRQQILIIIYVSCSALPRVFVQQTCYFTRKTQIIRIIRYMRVSGYHWLISTMTNCEAKGNLRMPFRVSPKSGTRGIILWLVIEF